MCAHTLYSEGSAPELSYRILDMFFRELQKEHVVLRSLYSSYFLRSMWVCVWNIRGVQHAEDLERCARLLKSRSNFSL